MFKSKGPIFIKREGNMQKGFGWGLNWSNPWAYAIIILIIAVVLFIKWSF